MCDVKPDPDPEICRGCLSTNRKLSPVTSKDLYYSLLNEDQKLKAISVPYIALCWECQALLQKTQRFLAQVERAHDILQDSIQLSPVTTTLSSLTFHKKTEYDAIFEESTPPDQPLFSKTENPNVTHEKIIIPTKYKTVSDVSNDTSTPVHSENYDETEYLSDNSGDFENIGAVNRNFSSSEEIKDDDLTFIREIKPNVELKDTKYEGHSSPTTIQVKQNEKTVKQNIGKPIHLNRRVKSNIKVVPFTKTPAVLKLEQELKKLMQSKVLSIKPNTDLKKKLDDGETKHKDIVSETKTKGSSNMVDTLKVDDCNSSNKRKCQKKIELVDPDFNLEATDEDYATDDSEEYKQVPQKKNKQSDTKLNSDSEDESNDKTRRFKKITSRFKKMADVIPYFTEIVMSQQDLKKALDKDDAIVDENKPYTCNICGMAYKRVRHLYNHALLLHKTKYPNNFKKGFQNPPLVMPEKSVWECHTCNRIMRQEHVVGHMNTYHRSEYKCNACEWWRGCYWKKEHFDKHYETVHKQFICDICEAAKRTKQHLEQHIQEVHSPKPIIYKCSKCRKTFTSRISCQRHERTTHRPPEPVEFRYCVVCDKTYKNILTYKGHCRLMHSGLPKRK